MGRFMDILKTEIPVPDRLRKIAANASRRTVKLLKWSVKAGCVLAVVLAVAWCVLSVIGGRQYEAELQKLKAKGEPYTIVDLAGPPVPASENGAVIYEKIFRRLKAEPVPEDARIRFYDVLEPDRDKLTPSDWGTVRRVTTQYDWMPPMVDRAVAMPKCKFPVRWQDGTAALFPHLAYLHKSDRVILVKAIVDAHDSKADSAVRCVRLALRTADAPETEPCVISLLVRTELLRMACKGLQGVMGETDLSATQAKALYDSLASIDLRPHCILTAKGERGYGLLVFAQVRRRGLKIIDDLYIGSYGGPDVLNAIVMSVWRPMSYIDGAAYLRFMGRQVDLAGIPYRDMHSHMSAEDQLESIPKYCILTRIIVPYFTRVPPSVDTATADCALGQAAMTVIAYKDKFGSYPTSLEEASTKVGWKIPSDPFTGKSLIYGRKGKGFIVYSIGANLKDDGGRLPPKDETDREDGDIVWSLDR